VLAKSLIYFGSNIANALIPLLMLPILTRVLTVEQYGQVGLFQTLVTAFAGIVGLSAAGAAGRRYFDELESGEEMATYMGSALQVLAVSMLPIIALTLAFAAPISSQLQIPVSWVIGATVVPACNVAIQMRLVQWQVRGAAASYGMLQVAYSLVNFAISLLLVLPLHQGGAGRVIGQIAAGIVVAATAIVLLRRDRLLRFFVWRPDEIRQILHFGLPLVPHTIGLFLLVYADRVVIANQLGLKAAGMYIAAMQLVGGAGLIFDAINKAYVPWLYERLARDHHHEKRQIVRFTYLWYAAIGVGVALAFLIGPPLFVRIAGDNYREAAPIIGWIALGQGLSGMYLMVTNYVFYSRRTGILAITTMASAAAGLGALFLLIPLYGLRGAAYAFCFGMSVRFLLTWGAAHLRHPMPWFPPLAPRVNLAAPAAPHEAE
jgi:O-antigen/teichoic acid export membrane protein